MFKFDEITLLTMNQIYGFKKINPLKHYIKECPISNLAILKGGIPCEHNDISIYRYLEKGFSEQKT